jgi:hypothetical protein
LSLARTRVNSVVRRGNLVTGFVSFETEKVIDPSNADLFDGFGNGSLHLYVVCTPNWQPYEEGDARYLNLDFHFSDWEALFYGALNGARGDEYIVGEDINEYEERNRKKFQQSIPEYPMLVRIFDMYEDYVFTHEEIIKLRNECLKLKSELTEPNAVRALRKLIYACDEASEVGWALMFVCD